MQDKHFRWPGWIVWLCAALGATVVASEDVRYAEPSSWVEHSATEPARTVEQHPTGAVYELSDHQVNLATEERYSRIAVRALAENGLSSCGELRFSYEPTYETLTLHAVRIWRDGHATNRLDPAKVKILRREGRAEDGVYDGRLSALVIVEDVRVGDLLDYEYTVAGRNPVFNGAYSRSWYCGGSSPTGRQTIRLLVPESRHLRWRMTGGEEREPVLRTHGGFHDWQWTMTNLPGIEYEENTPAWFQQTPQLQVSEYPNWAAVVEWGLPLYPMDSPLPGELAAFAETLRDLPPAERATAALHHVQEKIRYLSLSLGEASHRPHLPAEVFERRFGDCKDKALLLTCLLRRLGLDAAPALVDAGAGKFLERRLPSPLVFDHVIVHLRLDGKEYWLDPTDLYQAGTLEEHAITSHGQALPLRTGATTLVEVVAPAASWRTVHREELFESLGWKEPAKLRVRTTFRGGSAESMRSHLAQIAPERYGKDRLNHYLRFLPTAVQTELPHWKETAGKNELIVEEAYEVPGFWELQNESTRYRAEFSPQLLLDYIDSIQAPKRSTPLGVTHPVEVRNTIRVKLHEDWTVKPEDSRDETVAFGVDTKISYQERVLQLDYTYRSTADHVAPEQVPFHARGVARIRNALGYRLTYTLPKPKADPPPAPKPAAPPPPRDFAVNWTAVLLGLGWLAACAVVGWRLIRNRRPADVAPPIPADPHLVGLGGWLIIAGGQLVVGAIATAVQLPTSLKLIVDARRWHALTVAGEADYHALYAPVLLAEGAFNVGRLVFLVVGLLLFFRRSRIFPRFMLILIGVTTAFVWADTLLALAFPNAEELSVQEIGRLVGMLIGAGLWMTYYLVSRRVKSTFVN